MAVLTVDILQMLQERLGKEEAKKVAEAIELVFQAIEKRAEEVALQKKLELREDFTKELITKAEFYGETKTLRQEMQTMKVEIEGRIKESESKLEGKIKEVESKLEGKIKEVESKLEGRIKEVESKLEGKIKEVESKLEGRINEVEYKLESRIDEIESKLSARMDRLEIKFNFMILLLIIALTLMNPVVAEIVKNLLMK